MNLEHFATVGDLLDFIEKYNIPRTGAIFVQRVEDNYYNGFDLTGWGGLPEGTKSTPWETIKKNTYPDNCETEYTPVWSPTYYSDDKENLYLDLHY